MGTASAGSVTTGASTESSGTAIATTGGTDPFTQNLIAHYRFDDDWLDGSATDEVSQRLAQCDIALGQCPPVGSDAYGGQAPEFTGGESFRVVDDGAFDASTAGFSIALWAMIPATTGRSSLVAKPLGTTFHNSWQIELGDDGRLGFTTATVAAHTILWTPVAVAVDQWIHVAATYNGRTKRLYIDGVLVGESDVVVEFDGHDVLFGIDENSGNPVFPYAGRLDDVRIYDAPLPAQAVEALADGPS